jgi:putative ABC transport system permease protein
METILSDLRYAGRSLRRRPGFTALALAALALGIGANTAIFSIVNTVLLRPLPVAEPDRVVIVHENKREAGEDTMVSALNYHAWKERSRSFSEVSAVGYEYYTVTGAGDHPEKLLGARVESGFFDIMTRRPVLGRRLLPEDDRPGSAGVVVLRHGYWQSRFGGDRGAIGRKIRLNGRPYEVVGVMPPGYVYPSRAQFWLPAAFGAEERAVSWRYLFVLARLAPGVSLRAAQSEMTGLAARLEEEYPQANRGWGVTVKRLHDVLVADAQTGLLLLLGAVGLVLLIACANVASLLLARATARSRELAVRSALGARRGRIVRQLLTECVVLSLLGGALGLGLAALSIDLLVALLSGSIPAGVEVGIDGVVLAVTVVVSVLTGVLFGLAPVAQVSRLDTVTSLKEGRGESAGRASRRSLRYLVVAEVALAVMVLVSAGLLMRSFIKMRSIDPGYEARGVLAVPVSLPDVSPYDDPVGQLAFFRELPLRLAALPGVEAVGGIDQPPLNWPAKVSAFRLLDRASPPPGEEPRANVRTVSGAYFEVLRIPLVRGRRFSAADDAGSRPVAMVNRELGATFWPGRDPVGQRLELDGQEREVVGVAGDARERELLDGVTPTIYLPQAQAPTGGLTLLARTAVDPATLIEPARRAVWALDPELPVDEVEAFEVRLHEAVAEPRALALLIGVFALLALLLSSLGIYGIVSYSVSRRIDEIGLRMALGARPADVLLMIVRQGLGLVATGIAIGIAGAFALSRVLRNVVFEVSAGDPMTFAASALILTLIGVAASWLPARRAARVDPMVALRYE